MSDHHLASAETSDLLSSSSSSSSSVDDDATAASPTRVVLSDDTARYKIRHPSTSSFSSAGPVFDPDRIFKDDSCSAAAAAVHSPPQTALPSQAGFYSRPGPRYLLFAEGEVQMFRCRSRSVVTKLLKAQCLRHWESKLLILGSFNMIVYSQFGNVEQRIPYCIIEEIEAVAVWRLTSRKFCVHLSLPDFLLIIQTNTIRQRDQLLHSIRWKSCISRFWKTFQQTTRCRSYIVYDFKEMVEAAASSPILDDSILEFPLDVLASLLDETQIALDAQSATEMFAAVAPLLETCAPTKPVLDFFTKYSGRLDVGHLVIKAFAPIVYAILKHNLDIGRRARRRIFVQEYIEVLRHQKKNGRQAVFAFIKRLHGSGSRCPHLRILPNLVSVCLPVIHGHYEAKQQHRTIPSYIKDDRLANEDSREEKLITYLTVMRIMCEYSDWLPHMARLLQPVPFPLEALADDLFLATFSTALLSIGDHERCEVHSTVLGARDGRRGWFDHFCPGSGLACSDGGKMYCTMLKRLLGCCGRRRQFIEARLYMLNTWCALAESSDRSAVDILIAALEYKLIVDDNEYSNRRIEKAILSTEFGERAFHEFCQRQKHLREIQQKIGPKQLTLQSKATDSDLSKILNSGSFGNLECLTLAFTDVTSACAQDIIMLPFLQQLNLWSTQFGDAGVELLSEHMRQLQVLNLCETPVTDRGLRCLSALKSLRKLNLNSTKVSALTFEKLKENLPLLQEYDVCYTDAW